MTERLQEPPTSYAALLPLFFGNLLKERDLHRKSPQQLSAERIGLALLSAASPKRFKLL